nr:MAG TPA: MYB PROTO-ONCOGENE PROTEIN, TRANSCRIPTION REGULATION, MYB, C-MYB.58A [Crassvirales sp.]
MVTKKRWTKEEEEILVQAITANPHNITEACRYASTQLEGRTHSACVFHWYKALAPAKNPTKVGITFIAVGPKTVYKNRKNSGNAFVKPERSTLWTKIKKFIGLK